MICCYQVTKFFSTRYGSAIAPSARGPCNFGPLADLAISVLREVSINTEFTQILTSRGWAPKILQWQRLKANCAGSKNQYMGTLIITFFAGVVVREFPTLCRFSRQSDS